MEAHLIGSGIASLAAAVYLIKDGGFLGTNVHIYEAGSSIGGAMGMAGGPDAGYVLPTGRVFEKEFRCTLELFSLIPSASDPQRSIRDEIFEFNERYGYFDKAHVLDKQRNIVHSEHFGLTPRHRLELVRLAFTPEALLDNKRIDEFLSEDFFQSEFWYIWAPLMGSLPPHSAIEMRRFLNRFLHLLPDFSTMTLVLRTRFNQKEAIIDPLAKWLSAQGVDFRTNARVTSIEFKPTLQQITANSLEYIRDDVQHTAEIQPEDLVLVTAGSQVSDLAIGAHNEPPIEKITGRSWALWKRLAQGRPEFGQPDVFFGSKRAADTKWLTFTVTSSQDTFVRLISDVSASEPGRGGLMTLKDSGWLITLTIFHQPEFVDQPDNIFVWWGFSIYPDRKGNFIKKKMSECSGAEILEEVMRDLKFDDHLEDVLQSSICIPCALPFAGSVWMPRKAGDRPEVVPDGSTNFGFIGQFSEVPQETIFTMEYSVRSARLAVCSLCKLDRKPPPVYQGQRDPAALQAALEVLL